MADGGEGVTMLVVRPHPDDESAATGGMLAYYSARSVRTGVVICTGGEAGEIHDPDLDPVADMPRLREIRERELRRACAILGVAELRLLGYRDSGMPDTPANEHPAAFIHADPIEAAGRPAGTDYPYAQTSGHGHRAPGRYLRTPGPHHLPPGERRRLPRSQ